MLTRFLILCVFFQCLACTSNESVFSDKVTVDPVQAKTYFSDYVLDQGKLQLSGGAAIAWLGCTVKSGAPSVVLLNPSPAPWLAHSVCRDPAAQAFLKAGFNVVAVNRPQTEVLGDDATLMQLKDFVEQLARKGLKLEGLWAANDASVLGLRLAKKFPWNMLVIGNGLYDLEQTLKESQDQDFLKSIRQMPGVGEASFVEKRSAAWDLSGLPKKIYLYHGEKNTQVLPAQAVQFKASLAASEYTVELFLLSGDSQVIRPEYVEGVLAKILKPRQ